MASATAQLGLDFSSSMSSEKNENSFVPPIQMILDEIDSDWCTWIKLLSASAFLLKEKPNSSQLWRLYWSSHQRFFRHLFMSAKVPVTVRLAKKALSANKCVVIGFQTSLSVKRTSEEEAFSFTWCLLDSLEQKKRFPVLQSWKERTPKTLRMLKVLRPYHQL